MGHFRLISDLHTELWPENFYRAAKTVDRLLPPSDEDGDTVLLLAGIQARIPAAMSIAPSS
jgi:hypothetical protein